MKNMMTYRFALVGNPNSGKTTLFNELTGSNHHVGNWPGVTVERKEGMCRFVREGDKTNSRISIIDLPGIYSLLPNSAEEVIARDFIVREKPDLILNIVDATNLERNLYLSTQLAELNCPMVIALNMMDALESGGIQLDVSYVQKELGVPVVPISASLRMGLQDLINVALEVAVNKRKPQKKYTYSNITSENIEDFEIKTASKRYSFIERVVRHSIKVVGENKNLKHTILLDRIVCNKYLAIPIFLIVMFAVFQITFGPFGTKISDFLDVLINNYLAKWAKLLLIKYEVNYLLISLIVDGIIGGVGGVISFFPQILLLFFFLSFFEDSGYMARIAFVMDKLFGKIGLSGKACVPIMMGFGCTVPAVLSTRVLEHERDRKLTILLMPFVSCGAKMPIYAFLATTVCPENTGLVIFSLYLFGLAMGVLSAYLFGKVLFKGEKSPFLLELPPYRIPTWKSTFGHMWEKAYDFLVRAGTVLLVASVVIWFLQKFDLKLLAVEDSSKSIIASLGRIIAPIFSWCGFGNWQAVVSLIVGFSAKEAVVSSLNILYGFGANMSEIFTPVAAYAFLVFVLFYSPCIAAITTMKKELNSFNLTVFLVVYSCSVAWVMSLIVYRIGMLIV